MGPVDLVLLHTNDMHDERAALSYLASQPRESARLLVDAGDAIRGSNTAFHFDEPILALMNDVGYDAMAMGNRELNYLRFVLRGRRRQMAFPLLCANLVDERGRAPYPWQASVIKEVAGVRVGILGLTPVQYRDEAWWRPLFGMRFFSALDVLPAAVRDTAAQADLVVLLSHQGIETDRRIAASVPGIHVIIGGHSHTVLQEPLQIESTSIVQAGSHGRFVGRMQLRVGPDGSVAIRDYALVATAAQAACACRPSGPPRDGAVPCSCRCRKTGAP